MANPKNTPGDAHQTVNDVVNEALQRWVEVTKTNPTQRTFRFSHGDNQWSEWSLFQALKELEASRDLDPTGITTFMLLRGMVDSYLREVIFRACDIMADPAAVERRIGPMRELAGVLAHPLVTPHVAAFAVAMRAAAEHHKLADLAGLDKLLGDPMEFAAVRRDALRSLEGMSVHQFSHGVPSSARPNVVADVMEFWNMQSLLRSLDACDSAVLMALVRDPVDFFSYFAVAVRSGESVTIVTDRDPRPHPDYTRSTRRPDRALERRMDRGRFPYQLLDVRINEASQRLYVAQVNALVPVDATGVPVAALRDLPADQFVWALVMFELVQRRFGVKNERLPELSYTADMIADPGSFVGPAANMVLRGAYQPLDLGPVTQGDLSTDNGHHTGRAQWMVDRYGPRVPDVTLNVLGAGDVASHTEETARAVGAPLMRVRRRHLGDNTMDVLATDPVNGLRTLDPTTFGTRDAIQRDRLWIAKQNRRAVIETLARAEFQQTRAAVAEWFRARCEADAERLVDAVVRQEFWVDARGDDGDAKRRNILDVEYGRGYPARKGGGRQAWMMPGKTNGAAGVTVSPDGDVCLSGGFLEAKPRGWACFRSRALGAVFGKFEPRDVADLRDLLGVAAADIPWQLAHWRRNGSASLGSINSRVDPDDMIASPWDFLELDVQVVLGKGEYNRLRRAAGLPVVAWEEELKARRWERRD